MSSCVYNSTSWLSCQAMSCHVISYQAPVIKLLPGHWCRWMWSWHVPEAAEDTIEEGETKTGRQLLKMPSTEWTIAWTSVCVELKYAWCNQIIKKTYWPISTLLSPHAYFVFFIHSFYSFHRDVTKTTYHRGIMMYCPSIRNGICSPKCSPKTPLTVKRLVKQSVSLM